MKIYSECGMVDRHSITHRRTSTDITYPFPALPSPRANLGAVRDGLTSRQGPSQDIRFSFNGNGVTESWRRFRRISGAANNTSTVAVQWRGGDKYRQETPLDFVCR